MNTTHLVARASRLRSLCIALCLASGTLALPGIASAQNYIYGSDAGTTGPVTFLSLSGSAVTSSLFTNVNGRREWRLQLDGGAGGGGSNTALVSSNCVAFIPLGGSTNVVFVDTNCLHSEGFAMQGDLTTLSNYLAGIFTGSGVTNGLATVTFVNNLSNYLAGALNTVTNGLESISAANALSNFFANSGFVTLTITNGLLAAASTNSLTDKALVTSTSNTLAAAINGVAAGTNATPMASGFGMQFYTSNGTNFIAVDGTAIPMLGSNNIFTASQTIQGANLTINTGNFVLNNGAATLSGSSLFVGGNFTAANPAWLQSNVWINGSTVISNAATITGGLTVNNGATISTGGLTVAAGGANVTGASTFSSSVNAGTFNGSGSGLTGISSQNVASASLWSNNIAPASVSDANLVGSGVTPGSYGSASAVGTFTVNSQGMLTAAGSVALGPSGIATNAVSTVKVGATSNVNVTNLAIAGSGDISATMSPDANGTSTVVLAVASGLASNNTWTGSNTFTVGITAPNNWRTFTLFSGAGLATNVLNLGGTGGKVITNLVTANQVIILSNPPPTGAGGMVYMLLPVSNGITPTVTFSNAPGSGISFQPLNFINNGVPLPGGTTNLLTLGVWSNGFVTASLSIGTTGYGTIWASNGVTSLTYAHTTADSGSGTGTLTINALGGDFDMVVGTNTGGGQSMYLSLDTRTSFTWKHDTGASVPTKEFKIGLNTDNAVAYEVTASLGKPGFTWDFLPPHECYMIDLGIAWNAGAGYSSQAESANLIMDQMDNQSADNHKWYPGNNTNFPAFWVKAGGSQAASATDAVMNSDWINIGAVASTNNATLPRLAFIGVASNEDFLAVWQSVGMSTNGTGAGGMYSTNATDAAQFGTNRFAGFLFGRNGTFGAAYSNVIGLVLRDDTNGMVVLSVLTNGVYVGTTNNLATKQLIALP